VSFKDFWIINIVIYGMGDDRCEDLLIIWKSSFYIQCMHIRDPFGTRRVTLVTNTTRSHKCGKGRIMITSNGTYPWSCVTHIF
jgi:hypothetical protein